MVACPWCATIVDRGHCRKCARSLEAGWKICPWCRTSPLADDVAVISGVRLPRLLVVGEDGAVHDLITAAAADLMKIDAVATADAALTALWDADYDGVVVHDSLPDIGAVELLRMLRNGTRTAALPLMLVGGSGGATGDDSDPAEGGLQHVGVYDVLPISATTAETTARLTALTGRSPHAGSWRVAAPLPDPTGGTAETETEPDDAARTRPARVRPVSRQAARAAARSGRDPAG
jgi:DNA-binding response OmpR family regulator/RNA polymerase subunit RPABC4/transcription elongation factor Spt4